MKIRDRAGQTLVVERTADLTTIPPIDTLVVAVMKGDREVAVLTFDASEQQRLLSALQRVIEQK